jgi:hypothetical protein
MMIGVNQNKMGKVNWYDCVKYPVVGTSIMMEIDLEKEEIDVLGQNEEEMIIMRRHYGGITKI